MILWLLACAPTWEHDVGPIVAVRCALCHTGDAPSGGLDLWPGRDALLGADSLQSELPLVEPGDSLHSYLWHKLNGTQSLAGGSGTSMPYGEALDPDEIALFADWIDAGAR